MVTVVGDATSGVARATSTMCIGGTTKDPTVTGELVNGYASIGAGATFFLVNEPVGSVVFDLLSLNGAFPVGTDVASSPNAVFVAAFAKNSGTQIVGAWSSAGGSVALHLTSATAMDGSTCPGNGTTCFLVHGTVHAVLLPDASQGHPGQGTVTMDVTF